MSGIQLPESIRHHPYVWGSVACHVLLLGCLLAFDKVLVSNPPTAGMPVSPSPAVLHARQEKLQRQIQTMERIKEMLEHTGPAGRSQAQAGKPPATARREQETAARPERKARDLAAEIERVLQEDKAKEIARILKIPEKTALAQIQAERKSDKGLSIDELTLRASQALAFRHRMLDRQRNGVKLGGSTGAQHPQLGKAEPQGPARQATGGVLGTGYDPDSTHTVVERRNYGAEIGTPMVNARLMRAAPGRVIGAGGVFANRVYLDSWYMIGPFAGVGQESIDNSLPPEQLIDLDAAYPGSGGRVLHWSYEQFSQYPLVPDSYTEAAVYYGFTEVEMDRERDVVIAMGADDDAKLWVNDELVWRSGNNVKPWYRVHFKYLITRVNTLNLNETTRVVRLNKGRNKLLFKLYNGSGATFISIVMSVPSSGT